MERFINTVADFTRKSSDNIWQRLINTKQSFAIFLPHPDLKNTHIPLINKVIEIFTKDRLKFIAAFDPRPWQGIFDIPVISVSDIEKQRDLPPEMLIMHSGITWPEAMCHYFKRYGMNSTIIVPIDRTEPIKNFFLSNLDRIYKVYSMFSEELSKKAFCGGLLGFVTKQIDCFDFAPEPQYMLRDFMPAAGDIAIDGGSLDGETAAEFASLGADVYSFEMNEDNMAKCLQTAKKHNFTVENYGLWSKKETLSYQKSIFAGSSRVNGNGGNQGRFIDIDTYLSEKNLPRLDYLKLDIEGAELEALKGAANSIRKWKPKMAISVYHKMDDLWTIPEYLLSLRSDYKFEFRHYKTGLYGLKEDMDVLRKYNVDTVPAIWELVLYCK